MVLVDVHLGIFYYMSTRNSGQKIYSLVKAEGPIVIIYEHFHKGQMKSNRTQQGNFKLAEDTTHNLIKATLRSFLSCSIILCQLQKNLQVYFES